MAKPGAVSIGSSKDTKGSITVGPVSSSADPVMSGMLPTWKFSVVEIHGDWLRSGQKKGVGD